MSSGFSGGFSGGFTRSPLAGLVGKRSLAEFQQERNNQLYLRNVKPRSSEVIGFYNGVMSNYQIHNFITRKNENDQKKMMSKLQEIEKELLLDDDDDQNDDVSGVTDNTAWVDETIQSLLVSKNPVHVKKPGSCASSPTTSSSSSSCASSSINNSTKQLVSDAAEAISDGKSEVATELITRLNKLCSCSSACGNPEQKMGFQMASALLARVRVAPTANEMYSKEHIMSTQLLYDKSPCFKLCFMAANSVIMETYSGSGLVSGSGQGTGNIHVVDFDIGHGLQYVYLLHEIAAARKGDARVPSALKVTTFKDFGNGGVERLKLVGDGLKTLANKLGVLFYYNVLEFKLSVLSYEGLMVKNDDFLAVNFAFKLSKLPDESVTTENLRDEVLRRVKSLSPSVVTVAEQELNANTASFTSRVNDAFGYYKTFLDSFDATIPRENADRVKIEQGLSRKIANSVACEGRDRVERCEVFGKWRARMKMAGFESKQVSQLSVESLLGKLNSGTRGNPGFTVKEDTGGVSFGWLGRTLTVVSAWH